jgi:hypothetical protein
MTPLALSRMDGIASPVTLDWSTVRTLHSQTQTNTPTAIFTWLQQSPSLRGVHVVLDTLDRCERRKVRNQLLAMGCTVTAKVKFA